MEKGYSHHVRSNWESSARIDALSWKTWIYISDVHALTHYQYKVAHLATEPAKNDESSSAAGVLQNARQWDTYKFSNVGSSLHCQRPVPVVARMLAVDYNVGEPLYCK